MKKVLFLGISCLWASLAFFNFQPGLAVAGDSAEKIGLAIDQSIFTFDLNPGEEKEFSLKVKNISEREERLSTEIQDIAIGEQNEIIFLAGKNEINSLSDWLKVDALNWFLAPGEEKEVKISLKVPVEATPGSHFSVLALRALPQIGADNFQRPIVSGRLAVEILVNVKGEVSGQGQLMSFQAPILAVKEINFKVEFQNEGTVHYIPYGEVGVKDLIFRKEDKIEMPRHFVFPGKKYIFENNWKAGSVLGVYLAKASFVDGERITHSAYRIILGRYFFLTPLIFLLIIIILFKSLRRFRKKDVSIDNEK
jgi:hypothetical protein